MTQARLRIETVMRRTSDQLSADLGGGETVLMSVETGMYYGLDEIGNRIWALLDSPKRIADLCDLLVSEYDVDPETCRREVMAYLDALRREELVEIVTETVNEPDS